MKAPLSTRLVFGAAALVGKLHNTIHARSIRITGHHHDLLNIICNRPHGRPLLTISNHTSAVDDPLLWSTLLPVSVLFDGESGRKRWVLGAEELCFHNKWMAAWMRAGRVIPVRRGEGIYQPAMNEAIRLLNEGEWVHIFVEGRIGLTHGQLHRPIRWGVGRLIMESCPPPIVVPIVHLGVERVVGEGRWWPRRCHVDVRVGPAMDGGKMVQALPCGSTPIVRAALTRYLEDRIADLYNEGDPMVEWHRNNLIKM